MADVALAQAPAVRHFRSASTESPVVRATLITIAIVFLASFLVLPLAIVFFEAFRGGLWGFHRGNY